MSDWMHLSSYNLIIIRYNEIWLKSQKVKIRMLKALMNNIKNMLNRSNIEFHKYQLSKDSGRIFFFFKNEDIPKAVEIMVKVFGIFSISPSLRTSNKMENIIERVIEVGKEILKEGNTFALRVKRSGKQEYHSQDVAAKGGQAILDNFTDLKLKVNLSNPEKVIQIEIRDEFSYIFTDIIPSKWGGLPIEKNKKILSMDVGRLTDLLAGFLLMRRGSEIYPILFDLTGDDDLFKSHLSNWKAIVEYAPNINFTVLKVRMVDILEKISQSLDKKEYLCALCRLVRFEIISKLLSRKEFNRIRAITDGVNLNNISLCNDNVDLESLSFRHFYSEHPIFTPIVGLPKDKINEFLSRVSDKLKRIDYCKFNPKNQEINVDKLKSLYDSLNFNDLMDECLDTIEELKITL